MTIFSYLQASNTFIILSIILGILMAINDNKKQLLKFKILNYCFFICMSISYIFSFLVFFQDFNSNILEIIAHILSIILLIACNRVATKNALNTSLYTLLAFWFSPLFATILLFWIHKPHKYLNS
ncbi:hypothetical protein BGT96_04130 [Clostridioides difficile]|nr:hypothetical protein [Clostridioides difficile]EGT4708549.1 hypothetical protein [Clostridioides difficile]EGT4838156.1 hypothetical protein [Clostridioides difficile]EGT4914004.1 hypothetical protein [Clostridioides difficile]EGT5505429.1 hypothetical protein [Clostridioides difficile]